MITLNSTEQDVLREIANIGLSKSADALSFFVKERVLIEDIKISIGNPSSLPKFSRTKAEKLYILETLLKGEMKGGCYLVFDPSEVSLLNKICIPNSMANSQANDSITHEILLEIDNIVSASVITQFSNLLQLKIYGHVPKMMRWNSNEVDKNLLAVAKEFDAEGILRISTTFRVEKSKISPEFIWILDNHFLDKVKEFSGSLADKLIK